jgi:N-acetylneuraminate epimerase
MYKYFLYIFSLMLLASQLMCRTKEEKNELKWQKWSAIPDKIGYAGAFIGVSNNMLIAAGGANFPDGGAPWTGSKKGWTDKVFALESLDSAWKLIGKLPKPLGYGVTVNWMSSMIIAGGSNESGHSKEVYQLSFDSDKLQFTRLPDLPHPIANTCGVVIDHILYVLGGIEKPDAEETTSIFWSLDLSDPQSGWKKLPSWPGPTRMLAVAAVLDGELFLFSGTELIKGERKYLKDAYKYTPKKGWQQLKDLPNAVVAAPSPALAWKGQLLVFGGDDGALASQSSELKENHPGFSNLVYAYDIATNNWHSQTRKMTS